MRILWQFISGSGRPGFGPLGPGALRFIGAVTFFAMCAVGPSLAENPDSGVDAPVSRAAAEAPDAQAPTAVDAGPVLDREGVPLATAEPDAVETVEVDILEGADVAAAEDDDWDEEDWDDWDDELETVPSGYPDPLEPVNRVVLSFNNAVDRLVLDPVTQLYRFSLPDFARAAIVRLFDNVNSPSVMINDSLQLEWDDAAVCTSRLLVNTTLGLGGFMDPAADLGLDPHASDFGQTLSLAGVPAGMYFVLPLLGPANARDAVGLGVDSFLHPTFYLLGGTDLLIFGGSAGLTSRARHYEEIQALKDSSVDIYSALRSGYYQNREAEIWSRREDRRADDDTSL
jgi:phospholipid-binding lipoprotein MlaA